MILEANKTKIAYRCPCCGANVVSVVGVFSLSGDMIKLKCSCGGSALTITKTDDGKIRLDIPCVICTKPHNFVISPNVFFGRELFTFSCTYSGIDICFIGDDEHITKALEESDKEFTELLYDAGIESFEDFTAGKRKYEGEHGGVDAQVEDVVRFMLFELVEDDMVHCNCKDREDNTYSFEIKNDSVKISCDICGYSAEFPIGGVTAAANFLDMNEIHLTEPPADREDNREE